MIKMGTECTVFKCSRVDLDLRVEEEFVQVEKNRKIQ